MKTHMLAALPTSCLHSACALLRGAFALRRLVLTTHVVCREHQADEKRAKYNELKNAASYKSMWEFWFIYIGWEASSGSLPVKAKTADFDTPIKFSQEWSAQPKKRYS